MDNIIDKLYDIHLNTEPEPLGTVNKENMQAECDLYLYLNQSLSGKEKEAFLQYVNLRGIRRAEETRAIYEYGFKTAVQLFVGALKS